MKTAPSKQKSPNSQRKLQHVATTAHRADELAKAAKEKAHLAKVKFKAAKKVFKQAKKTARKAAKKAKQARKELKARLEKATGERKAKSANTRRPATARKKAPAPVPKKATGKTIRNHRPRLAVKKVRMPEAASSPAESVTANVPSESAARASVKPASQGISLHE